MDLNRNPRPSDAITVGTLTVTVEQNLTVLGKEPASGTTYPSYDSLILRQPVIIFPSTQPQDMYVLLNTGPNSGRVDDVLNLASNASNTKTICLNRRVAAQGLNLNAPDYTAYLWLAYSQSLYAQNHEHLDDTNRHLKHNTACLIKSEIDLINAMGISSWLAPSSS